MPNKTRVSATDVDTFLKALHVLARTADHVLGERTIARSGGGGLSASKILLLRFLHYQGPQTLSVVAYMLGVTKPAVTQLVDTMEVDKLLVRSATRRDRREVELRLAPRGRKIIRAVEQVQREVVRTAIRGGLTNPRRCAAVMNEAASALARAGNVLESFCAQCGAHRDGHCVLDGDNTSCLFLQYARGKRGTRRS